jgi:hypothetical protein
MHSKTRKQQIDPTARSLTRPGARRPRIPSLYSLVKEQPQNPLPDLAAGRAYTRGFDSKSTHSSDLKRNFVNFLEPFDPGRFIGLTKHGS